MSRPTSSSRCFNATYQSGPGHIGLASINYNVTSYGYDQDGRPPRVQNGVGTVTDTLYDALDRASAIYVGTNDSTTSTDGSLWTPGTAAPSSNMVLTSQNQYDGNSVGDGDLTQVTQVVDANPNDNRVTLNLYDGRDRLVGTKSGASPSGPSAEDHITHRPIVLYTLDNLGEVTTVEQYDGDGVALSLPVSASLLRAETTTAYDEQDRPYQTQQYGVNQSTGALSSSALTTNLYYDHRGNLVSTAAPGGLWTKDQYDGADRLISEAQTDGASGTSWQFATGLAGDHVLTQTLTTYDGDGNPTLVTTKQRFDSDTATDTGPLGNVTTGPQARVSYVASYYDPAERLVATVDVGTNGGAAYTPPPTVPASSDTTLVTSDSYGPNGWLSLETDPRGIVTQYTDDMLGQVTTTVAAYNPNINGGAPTASNNQTTQTTYDGIGDVTSVTAVMPSGTPSQTTAYVYGVTTTGGSGVNSNDLLAKTEYPDPTTGQASTSAADQESYQYNVAGDRTSFTDSNGTTHVYAYDALARPTSDTVTVLGPGVDPTVRRLGVSYDTAGRPYKYTSYNDTNGQNAINEVEDKYNDLGQLTNQYQEHYRPVDESNSLQVQYGYTDMSGGQNNSRPTSITYPNGRVVDDVYSSTGGSLDASISRLTLLADDNGGTPGQTLEQLTYLGLDTIVQRDHPEVSTKLTYIQQPGDNQTNPDGGDKYTGLDRFGRVIDQNWVNDSTGATTDRFQYGYDRASDVLFQDNLLDTALSELYHANSQGTGDANTAYDPLSRLVSFARGTLSSSGHNGSQLDTIKSPTHTQSWQLDALGNWSQVTTDGQTTTRYFNAQNQTTVNSATAPPSYDLNGNTVSDNGLLFVYDAWNRLVAVKSAGGGAVQASYSYDAQGWRIKESYPVSGTTNDLYYSAQWQVLEERQNGTGAANVHEQYVWSPAYIDALVLRDETKSGTTTRLYVQQDANWNTTAVVDPTGVKERYDYTPYGSVTVMNASWTQLGGSAYGWQYLHQGGRVDQLTGWEEFRARDYSVSAGHWAEKDPLGFGGGDLNLYRAEGNGPVTGIDPSGLENAGENHCDPLHLGGYPKQKPLYYLDAESHKRFHDYFREHKMGPRSGDAGRAKWARMTDEERKAFMKEAMRKARIPESWIQAHIDDILANSRPGTNMSPFRNASKADLAKLGGAVVAATAIIVTNPTTADAAEVRMDWRDSACQKWLGGRKQKCEIAQFRTIVMRPTPLNLFGEPEYFPRTLVSPWQTIGPTTATEAMMLEGTVSQRTLYWNPLYTVYEYTYYSCRWGGLEKGLPKDSGKD